MAGQSVDKVSTVETLVNHVVKQDHNVGSLILKSLVDDVKVVVGVEHIKVLDNLFVGNISLREAHRLVENRQCVAHSAVGFFGNNLQSCVLIRHPFLIGHHLQMGHGVGYGHPFEVVNLATREDCRQHLVLFRSGEDENHVCWRFLERLEEGVERCRREHVHLVDDENLVAAYLRRNSCLLHERSDILHRVVRCSVELEDIQRPALIEGLTALTLVAGLTVGRRVLTVYRLSEDSGTGGLTHAARTTEEIGMGKLTALDGVLQRCRESTLSHNRVERHRTILARRYYIVIHKMKISLVLVQR